MGRTCIGKQIRKYETTNCHAIVLFYHEASKVDIEQHLLYLKNEFKLVSLSEMVRRSKQNSIDDKEELIAITFDDGHADNYYALYPLCKKYGIPITIFQTSYNIGEPIWTAELKANNINTELYKTYNSKELKKYIQSLRAEKKYDPVEKVRRRLLSKEEIKKMSMCDMIEFEGHTHTHIDLRSLSISEARKEIEINIEVIKELTGQRPNHFCYPFGGYNSAIKSLVKKLGFSSASTVLPGTIGNNTDPYEIRRLNAQFDLKDVITKIRLYQIKSDIIKNFS